MESYKTLPLLDEIEIRILGSLIEKSKTTPEYYPLTLNSLTTACNQKSSRKPVVNYNEDTVLIAINNLKAQSLVSTAIGGSSRSLKYKHNFSTVYPSSDAELAILCLLFLRGPLTPGEINSNSGRLHEFKSIESVSDTLITMSSGEIPFVKELAKQPGQKETRYIHLLSEYIEIENTIEQPSQKYINPLEIRLSQVEAELSGVKQTLEALIQELKG